MAQELGIDAVRDALTLDETALPWLMELSAAGPPDPPLRLPEPAEARALLERLGVPASQGEEALANVPSVERAPALWWLMERCAHLLLRNLGGGEMRAWAALPPALGAGGRYVYVWTFLSVLPAVRRWHAARGIPDDISWATLADLGAHMTIYQRATGQGGLDAANWLTLHFRAAIYQLGRLQFHRTTIRFDEAAIAEVGAPFQRGDPALGVHIPEAGPLSPPACDDSFARARAFFARHFPETAYGLATCGSWLLDNQLADYLPADSNIVQFQRRFQLVPGGRVADSEIIWFVFRLRGTPLDALPQRTTLERAVVSHLRAGHHWLARSGWLTL